MPLLNENNQATARDSLGGVPKVVASITELRSLFGPDLVSSVVMLGYATAGDGGGGDFRWSATDVRADDGGIVIAPSTGVAGRWNRFYAGPIDVRWFGAKPNNATDASPTIQAALTAGTGSTVLIPPGTFRITSANITVPDGTHLIHQGTLTGTKAVMLVGSSRIDGGGTLSNSGTVSPTRALGISGGGRPYVADLVFTGLTSVAAITIDPTTAVDQLTIANCYITNSNYGILRQGGNGVAVKNVVIVGNILYNLKGDGIQWNLAYADSNVLVTANVIDTVNNTGGGSLPNWGMGIGFAGVNVDVTFADANTVKDFVVDGNYVSNVAQGIHVEKGNRFSIRNNVLKNIRSDYSVGSGLEYSGIVVYCSTSFDISDNVISDSSTATYAIECAAGVVNAVFVCPSVNYRISGNQIRNSAKLYARSAGVGYFCSILDNHIEGGGGIDYAGAVGWLNISRNHVRVATGTALLIDFKKPTGESATYNAVQQRHLTMQNNVALGPLGVVSVSLLNMTIDGLVTSDNNFAIESTLSNQRQCQRTFYLDSAGVFPYGVEFQVGDLVIDTSGPTRWIVTTAGSRNRASDTCAVYDQAGQTLKSTSLHWTDISAGGQHEMGQQIEITNIGPASATLTARVVRVYTGGGFYLIDIDQPISAANGTTGTITAHVPVAFAVV